MLNIEVIYIYIIIFTESMSFFDFLANHSIENQIDRSSKQQEAGIIAVPLLGSKKCQNEKTNGRYQIRDKEFLIILNCPFPSQNSYRFYITE